MNQEAYLCEPHVLISPGHRYCDAVRLFQGIPGIELAKSGRLWVTWYGGGITEDRHNFVLLSSSENGGRSWSGISLVIDPDGDGPVRAFDPCLWHDPRDDCGYFGHRGMKSIPTREAESGQ